MLIGVVYKKIHSLSLNSIDTFSKGKIINIAGAELMAFGNYLPYYPNVILLPWYLFISSFLLYRLFGWYCIFGLTSQILIAYTMHKITAKTIKIKV